MQNRLVNMHLQPPVTKVETWIVPFLGQSWQEVAEWDAENHVLSVKDILKGTKHAKYSR